MNTSAITYPVTPKTAAGIPDHAAGSPCPPMNTASFPSEAAGAPQPAQVPPPPPPANDAGAPEIGEAWRDDLPDPLQIPPQPPYQQGEQGQVDRYADLVGDNLRIVEGRQFALYTEDRGWVICGENSHEIHAVLRDANHRLRANLQDVRNNRRELLKQEFAGVRRGVIPDPREIAEEEKRIAWFDILGNQDKLVKGLMRSTLIRRMSLDEVDCYNNYLGVANGDVNLETGVLEPFSRDRIITRRSPIAYDPNAGCPTFLKFLARISEHAQDLPDYLHRFFGYCTTGETREQVNHIFEGHGSNGKSTLLEIIQHVLGGDLADVTNEIVAYKDQGDPRKRDLSNILGLRLAIVDEVEDDMRLNEAVFKQIGGTGRLTGRFLYKEPVKFHNRTKLVIATNHLPEVRGSDNGVWRRMRRVPFKTIIPEDERDTGLKEKLQAEAPGILCWLVAGAMRYYKEGLKAPGFIKGATEEYRGEQDRMGQFIDEHIRCLQPDSGNSFLSLRSLYDSYSGWCGSYGYSPKNKQSFSKEFGGRKVRNSMGELVPIETLRSKRGDQRGYRDICCNVHLACHNA